MHAAISIKAMPRMLAELAITRIFGPTIKELRKKEGGVSSGLGMCHERTQRHTSRAMWHAEKLQIDEW
jgi:hypothetical protein